jgi:DNA adenine methylase
MAPKPFVKWVGSKRQLIQELMSHVPKTFKTYHEPMVGGGAFYWALVRNGHLSDRSVVLADTDEDLIKCYRAIRAEPIRLVKSLHLLTEQYAKRGGDLYYAIRDAWNEGHRSPARFIFLKQTSFNGLWRYSQQGRLNMPWGQYDSPKILDADNLEACSQALQGQGLWTADFEASAQMIGKGDFVYFDPPYWGRFGAYGPNGFDEAQQVRLVKLCAELSAGGVHVLYTNEDVPAVHALLDEHWPDRKVAVAYSRRYVNCDGEGRHPVADLIVSGS